MESSTDLCFGAGKMAAERCNALQTGAREQLDTAPMAQLLRACSRMVRRHGSPEVPG